MDMTAPGSRDAVTCRIVRWAETRSDVRAVLLIGSRAAVGGAPDAASDHDVVMYATDPAALLGDPAWPEQLGPVLVQLPPRGQERAWGWPTRLVLFRDGSKIDFTVLPVSALREATSAPRLPDQLDAGYRVLLDRDGLAAALATPTGAAYRVRPPTQQEFGAVVEEFCWEATYVARNLWRDELLPARYSLECVMKLELLRRMLEWWAGAEKGWSLRPGVWGRGLRAQLPEATWARLEATFAGAGREEGWGALLQTCALFRDVALQVAERLGLPYPREVDDGVMRYLGDLRRLPLRGGQE